MNAGIGPGERGSPRPGAGESDAVDDVDRLFARLTQLPPPRAFASNVLIAARAQQTGAAAVYWALGELLAVTALALVAFVTGQAFVGGGAVDVFRALLADSDVVRLMPGDATLALLDTLPWIELLALSLTILAAGVCARKLCRALAVPRGPARVPARGSA